MSHDDGGQGDATRRDYVKYGGVAVAGLLAGCSGWTESDSTTSEAKKDGPTATTAGTDDEDGSYTVSIFPIGEVEFESVPETWMAYYRDGWGDMAIALGQADGSRTATLRRQEMFFDEVDVQLNTDWAEFWQDGPSKEVLYELDCDVHLWDPLDLKQREDWDESDIEEVETNIGPFFGSYIRRLNSDWQLKAGYPENAPTMLEAFEKLGAVFKQPKRAKAFLDLHAEVQKTVKSRLEGVEPVEIGLVNKSSDPAAGKFYPLDPTKAGYEMKQYRDLNVEDAFAGINDGVYGGSIDYEGLFEVDPDVIVLHWGIANDTKEYRFDADLFQQEWLETMADDKIAQRLTAVQEERVYPGAWPEQGPITNLFNTELVGQILYPDQFGEFAAEQYPDVPEENQLFDRQRVADIISGDF